MTTLRIAMWSGPRNLSTALMRSFGNRDDTAVWDEPFYAFYLHATGRDDPAREEVLARYETDWRRVVARILGPVPGGRPVFFQKHISLHLLPEVDAEWMGQVAHAFLIREPREVVASYARKKRHFSIDDLGFLQQADLYDQVCDASGEAPPVVDATDLRENPARTLRALCEAFGLGFQERMLAWPPGPRETDGVWARHWYDGVEASTGFGPRPARPKAALAAELEELVRACEPSYRKLEARRL